MGYRLADGTASDSCLQKINDVPGGEPYFLLCACDLEAPQSVREWADQAAAHGLHQTKYVEALAIANEMTIWYTTHASFDEPKTCFDLNSSKIEYGVSGSSIHALNGPIEGKGMPIFTLRGQDLLAPDILRGFVFRTAMNNGPGQPMTPYPAAMMLYLTRRPWRLGDIVSVANDMERWSVRKYPD